MSTLRQRPRGLIRLLVRLPVWLYRLRLGWLLGGGFLLLTHVGRKTGIARRTVLEVLHHDPDADIYFVAIAWGERSQWYRNIQHNPSVEVTVGRRRFAAVAERLSSEEAERVLEEYARRHRIGMRALTRFFGSDDVPTLAQAIPIVALRAGTLTPG